MPKVQVIASATGFDNLVIRNEGDVFAVDERTARVYSSWFKPVDPEFKVAPQKVSVPAGNVTSEIDALKAQVAQLTALLGSKVQAATDGDALV